MKHEMLGVNKETLDQHGAVSEAVVIEMALGAINKSHADYAIAVSGVAGPDGGTEEKPVGTVWIAWGSKDSLRTEELRLNRARSWFQTMVTATSLDLLRRDLLGIQNEPRYFKYFRRQS